MKLRPNLQLIRFSAPTFVSVGTVSAGNATASPGLPAGHTTNDILLFLAASHDASGAPSVIPSGYTLFTSINGDLTRLRAYWKRDGGAEAAPSITMGSAFGVVARVIAIRGCVATGSPIDQTTTNSDTTNQTALTCPIITTTLPNTMVVNAVGMFLAATTTTEFTGWTNASLTSITEAIDNTSNQGNGEGVGAAYGLKATIGAVSATTLTGSTNTHHVYLTFNLIGLRT